MNRTLAPIALATLLTLAAPGSFAADNTDMSRKAALQAAAAASASVAGQAGASADTKAAAKADGAAKVAKADRQFVEKAAQGGLKEVQLGKLAQDKASHGEVKQFGARMVQDHSKANEELVKLASAKGIELQQTLDKPHQAPLDKLAKTSADAFDRQYMKMMVSDHKKTIGDFEKASKSLKDPDLKAFAEKTLPTLKEHLQMAQRTEAAVRRADK